VDVKPRMACKPGLDGRGLVRAVVVHHQVDVQIGRHAGFYGTQELEELVAAMAPVQLTDHGPGGDVQRRKQRRCAMASPTAHREAETAKAHRG